jgi:hypothetical protein
MSGVQQRPLFSNAPVTPQAPTIPTVGSGSNLAAAMMQPRPFSLQTPQLGVPLGTMMALANQNPTYGNPNGTPSMGAGASDQTLADQIASNQQIGAPNAPISPTPPAQGPGMFSGGQPGTPIPGSPGMPTSPGPGMASPGSVGTPSPYQPGQFGALGAWIQGLLGGGGVTPAQ